MRKLIAVALFLTTALFYAQERPVSLGIKGGVNFANIDGDVNSVDFSTRSSYHVGLLAQFRLSETFSIQPEVLYSVQGAKVESDALTMEDLDLKYITVPVIAKVYLFPKLLSVEVGPQFGFMIDDNIQETFKKEEFDFSLVGGLAVDIPGGLFVQARYVTGMTEFSKEAKLKNRNLQLSIGFKF